MHKRASILLLPYSSHLTSFHRVQRYVSPMTVTIVTTKRSFYDLFTHGILPTTGRQLFIHRRFYRQSYGGYFYCISYLCFLHMLCCLLQGNSIFTKQGEEGFEKKLELERNLSVRMADDMTTSLVEMELFYEKCK